MSGDIFGRPQKAQLYSQTNLDKLEERFGNLQISTVKVIELRKDRKTVAWNP